jgi:hypothetical protein
MLKLSKKQYYSIHSDYRSVYGSDDIHGTNLKR